MLNRLLSGLKEAAATEKRRHPQITQMTQISRTAGFSMRSACAGEALDPLPRRYQE
jgi:hypothetical protein